MPDSIRWRDRYRFKRGCVTFADGAGGAHWGCVFCDDFVPSTQLCDGTLEGHEGTCDLRLCKAHAKRVGPNRDLCPECVARAEGRTPRG